MPNYFDILPMYLVVLGMLPLVMLLARVHAALAALASLSLYIAVPVFDLNLPAEIAFDRPWFFNPFAWQFLFYTGFFFGAGWIRPPAPRKWVMALCALYVLASIPLSHVPTYMQVPWMNAARAHLEPFVNKTDLGILRWLHFLSRLGRPVRICMSMLSSTKGAMSTGYS